jgi:hypothetical protein
MAVKAAGAILGIFLLLGAFSTPILDGIKTWRTDGLSTQTTVVATAPGATTANVTLAKDLYQANVVNIHSITSTDGADAAAATSYTEATLVLLVSGLNDDSSRTLTIQYYGETDSDVLRIIGPFLGVLVIGGLTILMIWSIFEGKKRRGFR